MTMMRCPIFESDAARDCGQTLTYGKGKLFAHQEFFVVEKLQLKERANVVLVDKPFGNISYSSPSSRMTLWFTSMKMK